MSQSVQPLLNAIIFTNRIKQQEKVSQTMMQLSTTLLHIVNLLNTSIKLSVIALYVAFVMKLSATVCYQRKLSVMQKQWIWHCHYIEAADKNAKSLNSYDGIKKLNFKGKQLASPQQPCSRCGKSNHSPKECKFKDANCHFSGKKGSSLSSQVAEEGARTKSFFTKPAVRS